MKTQSGYTAIDTAGQKTAVIAAKFLRREQPLAAKLIMTVDPIIEQVAFLEKPNGLYRSQMMGNELSVNGSLAGGYLVSKIANKSSISLEISGMNCRVQAIRKAGSISINFPSSIVQKVTARSVYLQGIRYLLKKGFPASQLTNPKRRRELIKFCGQAPAAGIIFYEKDKIVPLVYVRSTNSLVWENACGSGSLAFYLRTGISKVRQLNNQIITITKNSDKLTISSPVKEVK